MAPKKDKKKEDENNKAAAFTEVEKEFLVLQIADLNRKVARLRTAVDEYEIRNEELQRAYDQLDEDRADIIAYLKKTLNVKTEENHELKDKVKGLEETRDIEIAEFKETVAELEKNFTTMKDHLTSENKLLAGKLNTLEEFRAVRDDLMRKFEIQENQFKDQEEKYKKIIYEAEKKFTTDKDKLKKEMESRLLQLAQDFQDATELRIAASTHRVIRENIAINNELDNMLNTQNKLSQLNEKYKESERVARVALELAEQERDKVINKNIVQLKVIDQLTTTIQTTKKKSALYEQANFNFEDLQAKIQKLTKENEDLLSQVRTLDEHLHTHMTDQNKRFVEAAKVVEENNTIKKILQEAAIALRAALNLDRTATLGSQPDIMDRQVLLSSLLDIITQYREIQRTESTDGVASLDQIYKEGDLGFVPKPFTKRTTSAVSKESYEQMGTSSRALYKAISLTSVGSEKIVVGQEIQETGKMDSTSFITSAKSSKTDSPKKEADDDIEGMRDTEKLEVSGTKFDMQEDISVQIVPKQLKLDEDRKGSKSKTVKIMEAAEYVDEECTEKEEVEMRVEEEKDLDEHHDVENDNEKCGKEGEEIHESLEKNIEEDYETVIEREGEYAVTEKKIDEIQEGDMMALTELREEEKGVEDQG